MPARLVIVDDHPVLLRGMATLFNSESGYTVLATGMTADEAVGLANTSAPDVMILDLSMPGDVFVAIETITVAAPNLKLVVFTAYASVDLALRAFFAGARAFVVKGQPANELFDAVESVQAGELFVSPGFVPRLLQGLRNHMRKWPQQGLELNAQERRLLTASEAGRGTSDLATTLHCTPKVAGHYLALMRRRRRLA